MTLPHIDYDNQVIKITINNETINVPFWKMALAWNICPDKKPDTIFKALGVYTIDTGLDEEIWDEDPNFFYYVLTTQPPPLVDVDAFTIEAKTRLHAIDDVITHPVAPCAPTSRLMDTLSNAPPVATQRNPVHIQYSPEQIAAVKELFHASPHAKHGFIKVEIQDPDPVTGKYGKRIRGHWDRIDKSKIPEGYSKWSILPSISWPNIEKHISKPNCIVAMLPFRWGLLAVDIDIYAGEDRMDKLMIANETFGNPMATYPTLSGGWHSIYPIKDLDDAKMFPASGYRLNGKHAGEIACLHRICNIWEPISWARASNIRAKFNESSTYITPDDIDWIPQSEPRTRRNTSGQYKELNADGVSSTDIIDFYNLKYNPDLQEYEGHCPVCDAGKIGGGTRFKLRPMGKFNYQMNCWHCSIYGFSQKEYKTIVDPILYEFSQSIRGVFEQK